MVAESRDTVSLRLPKAFPLYQAQGTYEARELHGWVETEAREIAARFDTRNGTDRFQKLLERTRELSKDVCPFVIDAVPDPK